MDAIMQESNSFRSLDAAILFSFSSFCVLSDAVCNDKMKVQLLNYSTLFIYLYIPKKKREKQKERERIEGVLLV